MKKTIRSILFVILVLCFCVSCTYNGVGETTQNRTDFKDKMMYGLLLNFGTPKGNIDSNPDIRDLGKTDFAVQNYAIENTFGYLWRLKSGIGQVSYKYNVQNTEDGSDITVFAEVLEDVTINTTYDSLKFYIPKGTTIDSTTHFYTNDLKVTQTIKTNNETYNLTIIDNAKTKYMEASIENVVLDEIHYINTSDLFKIISFVLSVQINE